jgi:hypothetical protein
MAFEPYLSVDPELKRRWAAALGESRLRVGLVWQGNPKASVERGRSVPLQAFSPLFDIPGVRWFSLQKEHGLDQAEHLRPPMTALVGLGADYERGDYHDTAAVIANLDLLICCDTSVAHLAGALGRPVWIALNAVADWRWLEHRSDTEWYPSARLYRQDHPGSWASVVEAMGRDLAILARFQPET